jgi:hypothetical protein
MGSVPLAEIGQQWQIKANRKDRVPQFTLKPTEFAYDQRDPNAVANVA